MRLRGIFGGARPVRVVQGVVSPRLDVPAHIPRPVGPYQFPGTQAHPLAYDTSQEDAAVEIKNASDIAGLRHACAIARRVLDTAAAMVKPGVTTDEIDKCVHRTIVAHNAYPSPLHYRGFPKSVCTSVNDVLCHGIPDSRPLREGDIVNIDVTVYSMGFHGDLSETYGVGDVDAESQHLIVATKEALDNAIAACGPGVPFQRIAEIVSKHARSARLSVSPAFCGHGIGRFFHMAPQITHSTLSNIPGTMAEGMTFTIGG
eukprot:Opistho-2@66865